MPRRRISLLQEDRIWALACQGISQIEIAKIVGIHHASITRVVRRVRRRPPPAIDPLRRGRQRSFLSDYQIAEIRRRRKRGEPLRAIAIDYGLSCKAISRAARGRTYGQAETRERPAPSQGAFANRLLQPRSSASFLSPSPCSRSPT